MRTEEDIRDALLAEAEDVPSAADVLSRLQLTAPPPHRRIAPLLATAAAVLAVAVAVPLFVAHRGHPATARPADRPVSRLHCPGGDRDIMMFAVDPVAGVNLAHAQRLDCGVRSAAITASDGAVIGILSLYEPGRYDPTLVRQGQRIAIAGHQGYRGAVDHYRRLPTDRTDTEQPGLAWEYAPNAWAVVLDKQRIPEPVFLQLALRAAAAVRPTVPAPLRVAWRAGYLPAGYGTAPVSVAGERGDPRTSELTPANGISLGQPGATCAGGRPCDPALVINLDTWLQLPTAGQPVEVAGHAGRLRSATNADTGDTWWQLDVLLGGWHVTVSTGGPGGLPAAELSKIAAGLRLADPTNLSTWFDARTALP